VQWAQGKGMKPESLDTQLAFLDHELSGMPDLKRTLQNTSDVRQATMDFVNIFERPDPQYANYDGRVAYAHDIKGHKIVDTKGGDMAGGGNGGGGGGSQGEKMTTAMYGFTKAFLEDHKDIAKLVQQAENQQWTLERFQAEVKNTNWWENRTTAQRQWEILNSEQPGEAAHQIRQKALDLRTLAQSMGVDIDAKRFDNLAQSALRNGMTDQEVLSMFAQKFDMTTDRSDLTKGQKERLSPAEEQRKIQNMRLAQDGNPLMGEAAVDVAGLRTMADQYGIKVNDKTLEKQTQRILSGGGTLDSMRDYYVEQAKALYPPMAEKFDKGMTVADMMDPYQSIASQELGIMPAAMDNTDGKWTRALTGGKNGLMTADEWTQMIRNDKTYGWDKTSGARQQAADLTTKMAAMFGAI